MLNALLKKQTIIFLIFCCVNAVFAQHDNTDVRIINKPSSPYIEIRNSLLGLVIPKENTFNQKNSKNTLAPIQSLIYKDGTYSNDSIVYLHSDASPTSMKVLVLKNTSQECVVSIQYNFSKPQFVYGKQTYKEGDAGPGYYKSTIAIKKNSKSILIEEESDYDVSYEFKISNNLQPDRARYRGWLSGSVESGYEAPGVPYRQDQSKQPHDATVDLYYEKDIAYPFLSLWDPNGGEANTGRYWQIYNNNAQLNANLFGFFQGRPSRLLGARSVGVRLLLYKSKSNDNKNAININTAAIQMDITRRGPDNSFYPKKRFEWALFISTKQDLLPFDQYQPIAKEMNYVSGLAARIDDYAIQPATPVPAFFEGSIYLPADKMQALIQRIKTDEVFRKMINSLDSYFKSVTDAWKYPDSAKSLINNTIEQVEIIKKEIKIQDGIYQFASKYWAGASNFKAIALRASCLFADKSIFLSPQQKEQILQTIRMMARIEWDDDNVPFFDSAIVNYGPANMYYMYQNNGRNFFAMLFANTPEFKERAKKILQITRQNLTDAIAENGTTFGTPHYTQPTIDPILFSMLQLKQADIGNLFTEQKNKLSKFVDFYTALLTPPSVRFSGYRKLISFGDGAEESTVTFALLASGFEGSDPALSKSLYSIFQNGPPRMSGFGYIALAADLAKDYPLEFKSASSNYTGYLSHFRNDINSKNETAVWILNGDRYADHRNDDAGEIAIYALKTPLSLSRSCFYYPAATDARIRSVVVPEEMFPEWNKANQPISGRSLTNRTWPSSAQAEFAKLNNSVVSLSKMSTNDKEWYRLIVMLNLNEDQPIILFFDSVNNNKENIWSLLNMSQGAIHTPAGDSIPTDKIYDYKTLKQLPEATAEKSIIRGLNKFSFTGQDWPQKFHSSSGINWDLYTLSNSNTSFTLSQWTNTWQNSLEASEFLQTNGRPYSETQQILRVKSNAPFFHIVLPYFKGTEPYKNNVQLMPSDKIKIKYGSGEMLLTSKYYYYSAGNKIIISTFTAHPAFEKGFGIEGGVAETEIDDDSIKIRVHGNSGKRIITLPFPVENAGKNKDAQIIRGNKNTQLIIDYKSKGMDLLSNEQGYTEYVFKKLK